LIAGDFVQRLQLLLACSVADIVDSDIEEITKKYPRN
tara:strand:- start:1215 stop:1325 length:111 start_codon:yes stop_codon:yes gene_type:complete